MLRKHYVIRVMFPRRSGILLHVSSLPGGYGIGDFGESAYEFIEFLAASGQKIWQVLPLNPTGYGDSPYQCFSAFAGNPLFINLADLREEGLLSAQDFPNVPPFPDEHVAYDRVIAFKQEILRQAARAFFAARTEADCRTFDIFCQKSRDWLEDYTLFMACKKVYKDTAWVHWNAGATSTRSHCFEGMAERIILRVGFPPLCPVPILSAMGEVKGSVVVVTALVSWATFRFTSRMIALMYGLIRNCSAWMSKAAHCGRRRSSRLLQRDRSTLGQSALSLGCFCVYRPPLVD